MVQGPKEEEHFYRPRKPRESSFYQLVERFYPEFEEVYEERYGKRYGFWRPIIATAVSRFLECGDPKPGFARVRCPKCRHELFVALICFSYCTAFVPADIPVAFRLSGSVRCYGSQ